MIKSIAILAFIVVSISCISGCISGGDEKLTLEEIAEYKVIDNFREGNYEDIYELFNDDMKDYLNVSDLEDLWDAVVEQFGVVVDIEGENASREPLTEGGEEYIAVYIPCDFESGTRLSVQVVFDKDELIAGLWFLPL
ncbi:MAG: DUF3887 domain-containing protein [Candidatus Methanofastidiosa archaeon]|nr:DUF3887 domain-containing protein [Candidatus Methanofastidiosa archaeon]